MEVLIKSGMFRKKKFRIDKNAERIIKDIAREYDLPIERVIHMALSSEKIEINGNLNHIRNIKKEIDTLLERMFIIEGEWSSIRYRAHTLAKDNKMLAVVLTGLLSQNKTLRKQLGLEVKYDELRKLTEYYLFSIDATISEQNSTENAKD